MRTVSRRRVVPVLGALVLAPVLFAGCAAPSSSAAPSATATPAPAGGIQPDANVPTDVPNIPELRGNVEISACEQAGEGWRASGTAQNPAGGDTAYTITVFFTTDQATVLGTGDTTVDLPAGESVEWEIRADLTPAAGMRCVLRGVGR
ncbi:hypothetical protein [Microbacterium sp. BK668]|uniref:hypothetical protein n=1 Tax=Microbacterium sp. BK668 TaxID=2512118 RepID=UPI00105C7CCD|nr:hypothetical protein [Microbacterium sp. BK668]